MSPISPSAGHTARHPRIEAPLALALSDGVLGILQRTSPAPLPHAADGSVGGLASRN
jgi:hypothetical protein